MQDASAWHAALLPLLIFALAFGVRLVYVLEHRADPFFADPIIDSATYDRMAWAHAQGRPLADGAFWQPPLYPWFLSVVYRVAGHSLLVARVVQALLGAASCLLLSRIGHRLFGAGVGAIAGIAMALYGPLIFFDGEILIPSLYVFLLSLTLWIMLRASVPHRAPDPRAWLAAGATAGLAALARPNALLFLVPAALWGYLAAARNGIPRRHRARAPAMLLLGAAVVIAPVTVRNVRASHDFVLISANGGLNFYLGNNADAERTIAIRPGFEWKALVNEPVLRAGITQPSARSRYFLRKGTSFLLGEPAAAAALYGRKLARFWGAAEIGRNIDPYGTRGESPLLRVLLWRIGGFGFPFGAVAPLALAGMVVTLARRGDRGRRFGLLYVFLIAQVVSVVLFFVAARYRLAAVPVLLLFAAYFVVWLRDAVGRARWRRIASVSRWRPVSGALLLVGLSCVAVNRGAPDVERVTRAERDRYLGALQVDRGDAAAAETAYRRAIAADPEYAEAHAELAQLLQREGRHGEALEQFVRACEICPVSEETHYLLATGLAASGDTLGAEAELRRAIEIAPPFAAAYRELSILLIEQGRAAQAERWLVEARQLDPDDLDAWYKLGQCHVMLGRFDDAILDLEGALRLAPGDREIMAKLESLRRVTGAQR